MIGRIQRVRATSEEGAGLILVIGTAVFISTLVVTGMVIALNGLSQSSNRQRSEQALAVAESGVDWGLAKVQGAFDAYNADYPVPSLTTPDGLAPYCTAAPVTFPATAPGGVFPSEAAERTWARGQLQVMADGGCLQQTGEGQVAVLKPFTPLVNGLYPKYGKVYALAFVPSKAAAKTTRLVKTDYVFMPYRPEHAILSGGNLVIDSSTTVTSAFGIDPSVAAVHTNGSLSTNGNPTVTGPVTSTGSSGGTNSNNFTSPLNPGGTVVSGSTTVGMPKVDARRFYAQAPTSDPAPTNGTWKDLCRSAGGVGEVRAYNVAGVPCGGTLIATAPYAGWTYSSSNRTWSATRDVVSGVWFAHEANVDTVNGPDPQIPNFTVIASAQNADNCSSKRYGSIRWDHHTMKAPAYHNLWMFADTDIATGANFTAGSGITAAPVISGMFVAADQIELETSSAGAVGSVVSTDKCTSPTGSGDAVGLVNTSAVKNPAIYYDPNSDAPFTSIVNTTLWLDYNS